MYKPNVSLKNLFKRKYAPKCKKKILNSTLFVEHYVDLVRGHKIVLAKIENGLSITVVHASCLIFMQ